MDSKGNGIGANLVQKGGKLVLNNFTISSRSGGSGLMGPGKELLKYAHQVGAQTLRFRGTIVNNALRAKYGKDKFDFVVPATREGLLQALKLSRELGK